MGGFRTRLILVGAILVGIFALTGWSLTSASGLLGGDVAVAQYYYGDKKVTLCHKGKKTIRVPLHAVARHLRHGDTLGRCRKVKLCHKGKTIRVPLRAVPRHLRHGDRLGRCRHHNKNGSAKVYFAPLPGR